MPEANATALPDSRPPTTSSSASQVGVPSSREYSRPLPMMKFDAGISGTFSGAPGSEARPAETSHDSRSPDIGIRRPHLYWSSHRGGGDQNCPLFSSPSQAPRCQAPGMAGANEGQRNLFPKPAAATTGTVINDRCLIRAEQDFRIVIVSGIVMAQYAVSDQMAESYAMVSLVEQGWATQKEVARAFGCSTRSVRRYLAFSRRSARSLASGGSPSRPAPRWQRTPPWQKVPPWRVVPP